MVVSPAHPAKAGWTFVKPSVVPGFGLTFGYTLLYLSLIVLIPIIGLFLKAAQVPLEDIVRIATAPRTLNALRVSFGASFIAALVNIVFGLIVAWVLVRYKFPGRRLMDAVVDLPFALPTAVAGIALSTLYAPKGWIGWLVSANGPLHLGWKIAYTPTGIVIALIFIGLPFVVRTVQPVLEEFEAELEEAAATLGANRWQTISMVILPRLMPAILTGFSLAFARAVGEYGSVIFIAGNLPNVSEIAPVLIVIKLEEFDQAGAAVIAGIMLVIAFVMLFVINLIQAWARRRFGDV
ncbi:MAG: sulfate ABC transporter permease subunit CysT [Devosia sp.]|jgi:sulfate transport system permease protein|uniref:sulfate ABC transporter permease subunit CysT n=1 Tax=Devosia sp. 66-22 TaxID=1895753 RepID=UPI000927D89C|nr:sulfate ABC transporter permease subunit CysT [Devosia sp. 66-22]MBN9345449.1 sulfate ABC transporter permease subunit CysT [Devosia sp.]OJX48610.1 MAG: sulfate ABC transporter permease subunit CysT [Devosia sp. 66-22]